MRSAFVLGLAWSILALPVSGCIETDVQDGALLCSLDPKRLCPHGYYCAADDYCYHDGHVPLPRDLSGVGPGNDLSGAADDLSMPAAGDMSVALPDDLAESTAGDLATD